MSQQVIIFDTTLRDGEQALQASLSVKEKLQIALALERMGVDVMEVGFPVSSPGDFESVQTIARQVKNSRVCALARCVEKDIDVAAESLKVAEAFRIHTFIATSPMHIATKLRSTLDEVIERAIYMVKRARNYTDDVEFSCEDAGRTPIADLARVVEAAINAGATTINIPVGVAIYLACLALLPGGKGQAHGQRLDVAGAVTITASLMLAVYAIVNGNAAGWTSLQSLGLLGAAAALLAAFLFIESHVAAPLVPLPLLRLRNLAISNVVGVLWAASMFAWFFLSALYMQLVLGYDAMQVGLAFLPSNLIMAGCSLGLSAWVVMRFGICRTLGWGLLLAAVGLALFALAPTEGRFVIHVLPGMLLLGVGAGIALNPLLLAAMGDVKPEDSGLASGVVNTAFMMGGALGLAILASLADARTDHLRQAGASVQQALNAGYQLAFWVSALCALVAAGLGGFVLRPASPPSAATPSHPGAV